MERSNDRTAAIERSRPLIDRLVDWHLWWHRSRDPDGTGLVSILHPWESGRDNSVDWDIPLRNVEATVDVARRRRDRLHVESAQRPSDDFYNKVLTLIEHGRARGWNDERLIADPPFRLCDVGVQSVLVRADEDLLALMELTGGHGGADAVRGSMQRSRAAIQRLWDARAGVYRGLDLLTGHPLPSISAVTFLPLYAGAASSDQAQRLRAHFVALLPKVGFALPQVMPDVPGFDPDNYSRGPSWPFLNRIVADGFSRYDFTDLAERLASDSHALIEAEGFREYYNPFTGKGLGGEQFAWTAATWLIWAGEALPS